MLRPSVEPVPWQRRRRAQLSQLIVTELTFMKNHRLAFTIFGVVAAVVAAGGCGGSSGAAGAGGAGGSGGSGGVHDAGADAPSGSGGGAGAGGLVKPGRDAMGDTGGGDSPEAGDSGDGRADLNAGTDGAGGSGGNGSGGSGTGGTGPGGTGTGGAPGTGGASGAATCQNHQAGQAFGVTYFCGSLATPCAVAGATCADAYLAATTTSRGCRSDNLCLALAADGAARTMYCNLAQGTGGCN